MSEIEDYFTELLRLAKIGRDKEEHDRLIKYFKEHPEPRWQQG